MSGLAVAAGTVALVVTVAAPVSNVPLNTPESAAVSWSVRSKPTASLEELTLTASVSIRSAL